LIEPLAPSSVRRKDPFRILLLNIDNFKLFNDEFGHSAGDDLLAEVSDILKDCSRDQNFVARYGGEEFLLVPPSTNLDFAQILVDRIRSAIKAKTSISWPHRYPFRTIVFRVIIRTGRSAPLWGEA
jgi:diguanylate cyclase (GGDEF)-like protein